MNRPVSTLLLLALAGCSSSFWVTASGTHVRISPDGPVSVTDGEVVSFTVTPDEGYVLVPGVAGTCRPGAWEGNIYKTGELKGACEVVFSAVLKTFTVTSSGQHVTIASDGSTTVTIGGKKTFTITPDIGYTLTTTVGGTCPAGTWSENVYTTGAITADCAVSFSAALTTFAVTATGDHVTITPPTATVEYGATKTFNVEPETGYTVSRTVGGTCPAGTWGGNSYTTAAIWRDCTLTFSATINVYQVSATGTHLTISPNRPQAVEHGGTQAYVVTPANGYLLSETVAGTCPQGSWSGSTYTTGTIVGDCTVTFSASLNSYVVTPSATHVTISPDGPQTVSYRATKAFTVTPETNYTTSTTVGGTCPTGSWNVNVYTTGLITADCTVAFSASPSTYAVTSSGSHVSIAPSSTQDVVHGARLSLTVTPETGYTTSATVGGDCPQGSWEGSVYTTGEITGACSVSFSATQNSYAVSVSGTNATPSPDADQQVHHGEKQSYVVTADSGYVNDTVVGGTCPTGTWNGGTYTTGPITAPCSVAFFGAFTVTLVSTAVQTSPVGPLLVRPGDTASIAVAALNDYGVSPVVGGDCGGAFVPNSNAFVTDPINGACTLHFAAEALYAFASGPYRGKAIGDRVAAAAICSARHSSELATLPCNQFVPVLAYSPGGVTDLSNVPAALPVLNAGGTTQLASGWTSFVATANVQSTLESGGVVTSGQAVWSGFKSGGALDFNCDDWTAGGTFGGISGSTDWGSSYGSCANSSYNFVCLCWGE